jgi:hypothetical protein
MRGYLPAAVAMLAVTVSAQDRGTTGSLERPFSANGLVKMDLSAGDYHITGGPEKRVRLDWSVRDTEALAKVRATASWSSSPLCVADSQRPPLEDVI